MTTSVKKKRLPKHRKPKGTLEEYKNKLQSLGYIYLSSGAYASTWEKDGTVLKVAVSDPGYDAYLEYALANQDNPYFPKIYDVKRFSEVCCYDHWSGGERNRNVTVVTMEKLSQRAKGKSTRAFAHGVEKAVRLAQEAPLFPWHRNAKPFVPNTEADKEMFATLLSLYKERSPDLGPSNVMLREGTQFVITDPAV